MLRDTETMQVSFESSCEYLTWWVKLPLDVPTAQSEADVSTANQEPGSPEQEAEEQVLQF